jgi:hypothetical protein
MPMRTLLLLSLAFLVVGCPSTPPSSTSQKQVQGESLATPALAEPAPAETPSSPPASTTAGAPSDPCPPLSHTAQPPAWTGTPLHAAIYARDLQQVRQLDNFEATPLLAALSPSVDEPAAPPKTAAALKAEDSVQFDIVSELLRRGADVNQRGYQGITPLQKIAKMGYGEAHSQRLVTLLLDAKADVDARDARGATALMAAARANRGAVVQLLMARGAAATVTDCAGQTALDIARSVGARASIETLAGGK